MVTGGYTLNKMRVTNPEKLFLKFPHPSPLPEDILWETQTNTEILVE
jgi:hypothetical protein